MKNEWAVWRDSEYNPIPNALCCRLLMARNKLYCSDCCEVLKRLCISRLLSSTITSVNRAKWRHSEETPRVGTGWTLRGSYACAHGTQIYPGFPAKSKRDGVQLSNERSEWALVCLGTTFSNQSMTLNPGGKSKSTCLCKIHERRRIVYHRDLDI